MDEFPNSDEEFELTYGDEFELLREQEAASSNSARKSLNFSQPTPNSNTRETFDDDFTPLKASGDDRQFLAESSNAAENQNFSQTTPIINQEALEDDFTPLNVSVDDQPNTRKRTIEELFGDIDDILFENPVKKHKGSEFEEQLALIEHILEMRRQAQEENTPNVFRHSTRTSEDRNKDNLSLSVPLYPFVGVTRHDGVRVYVRFHSEEYEKEERVRIVKEISGEGLLADGGKVWGEAQQLIDKQMDIQPVQRQEKVFNGEKQLWVELYKPRRYVELLSDENTNRIILKWVKLWDKCVFKRNPKIRKVEKNDKKNRFEINLELDEDGRPHYKAALLCGPPGLGKTTLAHMVARHAGYNVIEINASDDRNVDTFKKTLENATQMSSVIDWEKRPNCIIFDEIDGAPSASVEFLVKFISGNTLKNKKGKKPNILRRPIICICNDAYVPSLRSLRQVAFVINFPPISNSRLAERLMEISRKQQIKTDLGAMLALAGKAHNDIRSCLSVLHFFKTENKRVTLTEIIKSNIGEKDVQKGLFQIWQEIFFVEQSKGKQLTLKDRMDRIVSLVHSFGDYDRLAQGVFENYAQFKNVTLEGATEALEWFCLQDTLNTAIYSSQNYSLATYLQYAFVVWHFVFATRGWQKLQYPSAGFEARTRRNRQRAIIAELMRGMQPSVRAYVQPFSLLLDVLPFLSIIISPTFRPISLHLYSEEEKKVLRQVVNVMVDYCLSYVQERTPAGTYIYKLDPNIHEVVSFAPKKELSYSNKQLIAKEIETAKMLKTDGRPRNEEALPNHLQTLQAKSVSRAEKPAVSKDFFGRIKTMSSPNSDNDVVDLKRDIWYQYKEGYSNAVRKKIHVSSLK